MNHQQFEQWLLTEEPLNRDQAEKLRSHLNACEACQRLSASWSDVRQLFRSVPLVGPESGFVARWQAQLEIQMERERQTRHRRQSWFIFIFASLSAVALFTLVVTQLSAIFGTPTQFLVYWLSHMTALLSAANVVQEIANVLFKSISRVIPLSYWITLLAGLSVLFLIWILSLRHIYFRGGLLNEAEN